MCVRACACVRAYMGVCVHARVCVKERERERERHVVNNISSVGEGVLIFHLSKSTCIRVKILYITYIT